jgi:tetratricopeptide (TPR) repeat protein
MKGQSKSCSPGPAAEKRRRFLIGLGIGAILLALLVRGITSPPVREWSLRRSPLSDLERRARARPSDPLLFYWLGRKRAAAEQLAGAEAAYRQAIGAKGDYLPAWVGLGETLGRLGRNAEAFGILKMAVARDPRAADAYASLALIDAQGGAVPRALEEARHAVRIMPRRAAGWYALGVIYHRLDQPGRVLQSLRRAVQFGPDEARCQQMLGETLRDMGKLDAAEPPLLRALALAPDYSKTHLSLGELYAARPPVSSNLPRAIQELERARDLAPRDWEPHYHLGRAYLRQRRFAGAARELARVLDLAPDYDPVLLDLSRASAGMGRRVLAHQLLASFEIASENYQRIQTTRLRLAHEPENAALHFELARLYLDRGRNRAAYAELQAGLAREPKNAWALATARRLLRSAAAAGRGGAR